MALLPRMALVAAIFASAQPVNGAKSAAVVAGVDPSEAAAYAAGDAFACKDGSGSFPIAQVNDDYCE